MRLGQFDKPIDAFTPVDFDANGKAARLMAEQGSVLLKNEGAILPLQAPALRSIALIGAATFAGAAKLPSTGPKGIITVNARRTVTPLQGLQQVLATLGSKASVTHDGGTDLARAQALAKRSDIAIVMAGDISLEGEDRTDLSLPVRDGVDQDALIAAIAQANPRTVVVLKDGGPVLMPWLDRVPAVLEAWYPGQEDGIAVANVLFGIVNPSGKLPVTFPKSTAESVTASPEQWPGTMVQSVRTANYTERLAIGYRWYDAHGIAPLFAFGHGLSYTSFSISALKAPRKSDGRQPIAIQFTVQNTGKRAGAEVAQVYLGLPPSTGEPPKRLVGFTKVQLEPGEKKTVRVIVDPAASNHPLGYWDTDTQKWLTAHGAYRIFVGASAASTPLRAALEVKSDPH